MSKISKPKAIILDIEGTTSDRKFIKNNLFPFIKNNLIRFLIETFEDSDTKDIISRLREGQKSKKIGGPPIASTNRDAICKSVVELITWLMERKMRISELKQIEIQCWFWGYQSGLIKSHVYDDVPNALHKWKVKSNIKICTFSSGLSIAQQLMFCRTNRGNIHCLIDNFFDNTIGDKKESQSYGIIANTLGIDAKQILFISDSDKEVKAALSAGLTAALIKRPGNNPCPDVPNAQTISSFAEIKF